MAIVCILCGGLQILLLLSLTGVLVSLAALARLMELIFTLVQPTVRFMLRQSVNLIVFWIVLSLRRTSVVLGKICSNQPSDSGSSIDCSIPDSGIEIGTTPIRVPYSQRPYENKRLVDIEKKKSLSVVREPESSEDIVEDTTLGSTKSTAIMPVNVKLEPKFSGTSSPGPRTSSQHSDDLDDRRSRMDDSEET